MATGRSQVTVEVMKGQPAQVQEFGCNGTVPQTAVAGGASVVTTAATNTTPYGFATQAQADALVARVNTILAALKANGILS